MGLLYTPAGPMKPQVYKFGGVAVGSAEAIRRAVAHVRRAAPNVAVVVIHAERRFGALWPDLGACERAAKKIIAPLLANRVVVVMPGYIASGPDGSVVTLGRGGSDFSAAILARSTGAEKLTLFKEVD